MAVNKRNILVGATVAVCLAVGSLVIWDRIPEVDPVPANGPIENLRMSSGRQVPMAAQVVNPAGISFVGKTGTYLVSTDDRVFAEISGDFKTVLSSMTIANNPNSIGDTEGVVSLGDGQAAAIGENGVIILLVRDGTKWKETKRVPIDGFKSGSQLGSAAYDAKTGVLYSAQKKGGKFLYKIDIKTGKANVIPMKLSKKLAVKTGRNWSEFTIAGMHFHNARLYAISEAFSSILVISPQGVVEDIVGIKNINESSGITVRYGILTLIGDAESYLPKPPIYLIDKSITNR